MQNGKVRTHDMLDFDRMVDEEYQRPRKQWWLKLRGIATLLAQQEPSLRE
jgi:hypothetical protein